MVTISCGYLQLGSTIWRARYGFRSGSHSPPRPIQCGLRGAGTRKPLWRSAVMSTEAIHAVQALKLAKKASDSRYGKLQGVLNGRVSRLITADLLAVLAELQRQNEWEIALQVFDYIRKEECYQPDLSLYSDMICMLGKNKMINIAEDIFVDIQKDGLQPNSRAYTEIIGAFLQMCNPDKAMDMYNLMKESGCPPNELTFTILLRNLEKIEEFELVCKIKKDCEIFLESPEKFLEEVSKKYPRRRTPKLI